MTNGVNDVINPFVRDMEYILKSLVRNSRNVSWKTSISVIIILIRVLIIVIVVEIVVVVDIFVLTFIGILYCLYQSVLLTAMK